MKRRILAMFLAFVMVLGILPVQTFADETEPIEILESVVETTAPSPETEEVPPETESPAEPSETFTEATELPPEETTATTEQTTASVVEVASAVEEDPEVTPADPVKVYVTVSNQGILAQTQTGEIMFNKPVTVTDINKDGYLTYDEALSAAHDAYCPGGFSVSAGAATKLWGVTQTTNYLFFKNDVALTMGITVTDSSTVSEGDKLYASVNQDNTYWADWYTYFNKTAYTVDTNTDFTLNLQGYLGMGGGSIPEAVGGVSVGIWKNGAFEAIEGKATDASGNVTLSFPEAGTYYVTASGTVSDEVEDWSNGAENPGDIVTVDCPIMAPCCVVTVKAPLVGKVTVNATAQLGADFLVPPLIDEEVSGNLAESYGFTDRVPVANVSALDVLVKVHEEMFGEGFTADTASDYLVVGTSGWITKIFADDTASVAFLVNSDFPADAEGNSYCVDQAQVVSGDLVQFACYEDTNNWSDACVWLELEDGTKLNGQSIPAGSSVDVVVKKYASYGATDTVSVPGTAVYLVDAESGALTKLADTDDSGKATITIPGTYANTTQYVTAYGTYTFMTLAKVSVDNAFPGSGTEEDPYRLETAEHLVILDKLVTAEETFEGKYFKITNDITVSEGWGGIGYAKVVEKAGWGGTIVPTTEEFKPFMGTLDGQGYTVTFPTGSQPLFDCVRNATIKNIKISGDIADDGLIAHYAQDGSNKTAEISGITVLSGTKIAGSGLLGGYASGSNVVNITNCHIEEGVTIGSDDASHIGGIAGDFNGKLSNSTCAATVRGKDFVGGIVASQGQSMSDTVISNCTFSGQVIATGNYVGGIAGSGYTGIGWGLAGNGACIDITDCTVTGSITGDDYVGGILGADLGVLQCWDNGTGNISNNAFTGTISSNGNYIGGVIGYLMSMNYYTTISGNSYKPSETVTKGIGCVVYVDTSYDNPTPVNGTTYINTSKTTEGLPSTYFTTWYTNHNRTDDPLGADKETLAAAIRFPGSGTEEDPYRLETAEHLDILDKLVTEGKTYEGAYFQITSDITVSEGWDGIGYARVEITNTWGSMIPSTKEFKPFMGTLDGQGYTVTFPTGSQPLFDCVRNATIKNIKISGDIADDGLIAHYAQDGYNKTAEISGITVLSGTKIAGSGLLGGYASGSNVVNITDCHIEEGVTIGSAEASNIGGIAGDFNGTISNSTCAATVYGKDFVGGIVAGQGQSMSNTVISGCVFSGQVIASGNYVGGISGCGYTGTGWGFSPNAGCIDIKDCTVNGSITGGDYVGGILGAEPGVVQCWSNATGEITGNIFTGTISTAGQYVGGVIGYMKSINRYNIISGNRYQPTETVTKGIGGATYVDTSYANPTPVDGVTYVNSANGKTGISGMSKTDHNRTDDPLGVHENDLCLYDSTLEVDGGNEVVGGKSTTVRVIDSETGKALKTSEVVWSLASPDYNAYATVSASGKLNAYPVSTQHVVRLVGQLRGSYSGEIRHTVTIYPAATQVEIWNGAENVTGKTLCLNAAEGSRLDLTGKLYPTDAKEGISWKSSDAKIAKVDSEGTVTATGKTGTVTITATAKDGSSKKATMKVQLGNLVTKVTIAEPASTTLRSGKSVTLKAQTTPEKPTVSGVTFSLVNAADSAYATVSSSGKVTAKTVYEPHVVVIKATSKDAAKASNTITLTILPKSEQMLILKSGETYVTGTTQVGNVGDTIALFAFALNTEAEPKEEAQTVTWKSSNTKVATVVNGIVNCVKTGTAKITATANDGSSAVMTIKVTNLVKEIKIETKSAKDDFVIASGKSVSLKANITPANASSKKVTWSITSGAEYAKITSSGVLKANSGLTSSVQVTVCATAKDGSGVSGYQAITINPLTHGVRIMKDSQELTNTKLVWDMSQDAQLSLYARVYPKTADDSVTWKSSSTKIASIDANGTVTCHKAGTVTITATANDGSGKKVSFKLSFVKLMKELKLEGGVIAGGKSLTLKPVITPADTTNKKLTWSISENTVGAKISSSGKLTTKAVSQPATVTITAAAQDGSGLTASCDVTIYPATTKVVITGKNGAAVPGTLAAGAELKLAAAGTPANAANVYTWKSNNKYVTVADGTVTASKEAVGKTVTITCTTADGTNKSTSVKIKIVAATEG